MAGIHIPYDRSTLRPPMVGGRKPLSSPSGAWLRNHWAQLSPAASVLAMVGYFLLLGSLAVVVVTGEFPWFTVAPITILLSVAYFRHVEAKDARLYSQNRSNHSK